MKKLSIILVICVMISSLAFSANAATMDQKSQEQTVCVESINSDNQSVQKELAAAFEQAHLEDVQAAQAYAYLDLESASEEMKEKILEARNTIIFSQGWVADGGYAYIGRADGTIEVLPQFSDLFPGWDIPIEEPRTVEEISAILATQSDLTEFTYNN